MTDRSKAYRAGARAVTGLAVVAGAAVGALALGTLPLPTVERAPHAIAVDATQTGERSLVCAGPFAELGADPSRPDVAVPVGEAALALGGAGALTSLGARAGDATSTGGAKVLTGDVNDRLAAAQFQQLGTATLSGLVASTCVEPVNEQWILGGASTAGFSTTLSLGNASAVSATVQISVFDENGEVPAPQTAGVIVAPHSQQTVSLGGYAPNRERLAVRVTSTGAPVAASLGVARIDGLTPTGAAVVTRQLRPTTSAVIAGVGLADEHNHDAPGDAGPADRFPVLVQALAPGRIAGTARVYALDSSGARTELGTIELAPKTVGSLTVATWPREATAIAIEADVPVFSGAQGTANSGSGHDFDWFAPAPEIAAGSPLAVPIAQGWSLVLVNTGDRAAEVRISGSLPATVTVRPGASLTVAAGGDAVVTSTEPIHAGVRRLDAGAVAGYPVLPPLERGGRLTVYTR